MRASPVRLLTVLIAATVSGCAGQSPHSNAVAGVTYSCCEAKDVETLYQPGQTLSIHWKVNLVGKPGATSQLVELTARLTGPFATEEALKAITDDSQGAPGRTTFEAAVIRPTGMPGERPVSAIAIGSDAKPGYYNLSTAMQHPGDGSQSGGATIVRVIPKN